MKNDSLFEFTERQIHLLVNPVRINEFHSRRPDEPSNLSGLRPPVRNVDPEFLFQHIPSSEAH